MPFRLSRRKSVGGGSGSGASNSGLSVGRRGRRVFAAWAAAGPSVSLRLLKGLSDVLGPTR
jgi:hypothetical protein